MAKSSKLTEKQEMKSYTNIVLETARYVEMFRKKKVLNIKPNKAVMRLIEGTNEITPKLSNSLTTLEKESRMCCGGGE